MTLAPTAVEAYLHRLGASRPRRATGEALRELHDRHVLTVPFETVDLVLHRPVPTGAAAVDKITVDHRGGCCYEVNTAFGELLRGFGYGVEYLGGRVFTDGVAGLLLGHLVLRVQAADSGPWLVDVGFGRGFRHPKLFAERADQPDPLGVYRLADAPCGDVDVYRNDVLQYRLESRPRSMHDFGPMMWWHANSPDTPVADVLFCSMALPDGKVTLAGSTLTRVEGGDRVREVLDGPDEIRIACRKWFGIELDGLPPGCGR